MRALCKSANGHGLSARHFESGYTALSEFDLEKGREYVVYGILLSKGLLSYLINGEGGFPHWYPAELFTITRTDLPPNWYFACFSEIEGFVITALWGYDELITVEDHFDALSNLEQAAIQVFLARKNQIDKVS